MDKIYDKRCHIPSRPPPPISMLLAPKHLFSHEDFIGGGGGEGRASTTFYIKKTYAHMMKNKITKYVLPNYFVQDCGRTANLLKFVNEEVECDHKGVKLAF